MELAARWTQITTFQKRKFTEKSQQPKTPTMLQGRWKDAVFVLIGEEKKSWRVSCCLCVLIILLPREGESFLLTWFCLLALLLLLLLLFFCPRSCARSHLHVSAQRRSPFHSLRLFVLDFLTSTLFGLTLFFVCLFVCFVSPFCPSVLCLLSSPPSPLPSPPYPSPFPLVGPKFFTEAAARAAVLLQRPHKQ